MKRVLLHTIPLFVFLQGAAAAPPELKFRPDGSFKILVISDLHYGVRPDPHGLDLTKKLIAIEHPDLVIATGDNLSGECCTTPEDVKKAVANVASVMEETGTPWAVTLGNHDVESSPKTHIGREEVFTFYESHPHNMNGGWERGIHGAGNKNLLIRSATGSNPVFNLWLIDSGPGNEDPEIRYDWIHTDQVAWYRRTSRELEEQYGAKIPAFMFFHIPLPEFHEMILTKKVIGERHEPESPSRMNGGMFAAVMEAGDVKGIFCGHDHVNNYVGKYRGITLGHVGVVGYAGYPHTPADDVSNERARGARVLLLQESDPGHFRTWMRLLDGSTNWEYRSDAYERDLIK
jgi:hypothetical protein